jgi:hypothetical protein
VGADLGKSDEQVGHAIADMRAALNAMIEATGDGDGRGGEIDRLVEDDLNVSLSLDPKKIEDEFERLKQAAFQIGENAESVVMVRQAKDRLAAWHGGAADEFRMQLDRIELFVTENQYPAVAAAVQSLGALFSLAYHMRQSYYDLALAIRSCANHEIDQQQTRDAKLNLAIGKEIVLAIMAMNPATAVAAGLVAFVEAAGALGDQSIEGTGADAVIDAYRDRSIGLRETFESNLNQLSSRLHDDWAGQVDNDAKLEVMKPLKPITDVGSPDFSYEEFSTEEYPPGGPFADQVDVERKRYAQEEEEHDTEINKRLEGQDR